MRAMQRFEVLIVGAGMAGASLAWQLTAGAAARGQSPLRVALLERESQPGYHATGRSAAVYVDSYGPEGIRALTRASRSFYTAPPDDFAGAPLVSPRGALYVAAPGEAAALQALADTMRAGGAQVTRLDAAQTLARVPALRAERVLGALYEDDVLDLDVHAIHQGYLRGFKAAGGTLLTEAELFQAEGTASGWDLALADGRLLHAQVLVNAAGAWGDDLAARCGVQPVGLVPKRRAAFTFEAPQGQDIHGWPMVMDLAETCYVKPDAGVLLGSPANADPMHPHDVQPEEMDIAIGIDRITQLLDVAIRRPRSTWAGLRSFVADGEPVIGWDDGQPGFFWLVGQGGYGIQTAPGASLLAASLLQALELPAELVQAQVQTTHFSPWRMRQSPRR